MCAEKNLVKSYGDILDCSVLQVGHHGSKTSTTEEFISCLDPEFAIISSGRADKFNHPSPGVVSRLKSRGIEVLRTDIHGGILLEYEYGQGDSFRIRTSLP
jgi:competence protein ComEC